MTGRRAPPRRGLLKKSTSLLLSTAEQHKAEHREFYGPYAHIRKTLDYSYHTNYTKKRQELQNAIISSMITSAKIVDVNNEVGTTPQEPWIVFTAGAMGAGKGYAVGQLVQKERFPVLGFVSVDPDEIRRLFPEYGVILQKAPERGGEMTRQEAGFISEILTMVGLQAGKNVLVDGSLRDHDWYGWYFKELKKSYPSLKIAIIHIAAPREAVFARAIARAKVTGRVVPVKTLEMALAQVPKSVKILGPQADYFVEFNNAPGIPELEIMTPGVTYENFTEIWRQVLAWVPGKKNSSITAEDIAFAKALKHSLTKEELEEQKLMAEEAQLAFRNQAKEKMSKDRRKSFDIFTPTNITHKADDETYYGPNAHTRAEMDSNYHNNFVRERQWLQDSIVEEIIEESKVFENGEDISKPDEPWIIFTAGAIGANKFECIRKLIQKERFPLFAFMRVDQYEIRSKLPEYQVYAEAFPNLTDSMVQAESSYIQEMLVKAGLEAERNIVVDGILKNVPWYKSRIEMINEEFPKCKIAILHITAPVGDLHERAMRKAKETGQDFDEKVIKETMKQVPESVAALAPYVDYVCKMSNIPDGDVEILTEGQTWETFYKTFEQERRFDLGHWTQMLATMRKRG